MLDLTERLSTTASCTNMGEGEFCGIMIGCKLQPKPDCVDGMLYKGQSMGDGVRSGECIGLELY
jgi:hypothetical protein